MKRLTLLLAFLSFLLGRPLAQAPAGDWRGHVAVPGGKLEVVVHLVVAPAANGALTGTIDIPAQEAEALPLRDLALDGVSIVFTIADVPGTPTFRGTLAADGARIEGTFTQGGQKLPFVLERAAAAVANERARLDGLQAWLDESRPLFDVPGCAVVVVKGGEVLATFASGHRDVAKQLPVDADTLFAIGSSSKAFTTCLLAMLVDDGVLDWDAPVRRWIPDFALADAAIGERLTPRDLVTHRSGMPRHDLVWYGATFARAEMVARLRHLPLNHDLRTDFQYNNLMFLTAGHLAERIAGGTWEQLVQKRILQPLGMARTDFDVGVMQMDANHAVPYRKDGGKVAAIPFRDIRAIGPAGSINSSVREMANWAALQLQNGSFGGARLLAATTAADLHTVRMPTGVGGAEDDVLDVGYALGWFVDVYRGHRRVHHGGNIDGFSALVAMLPDDGYGVVVLTNLDGTPFPEVVVRAVSDRVLGLEPRDFRTTVVTRLARAEKAGEAGKKEAAALRRTGTSPSRALDDYVGDYANPGYGSCRITRSDAGLRVDLHGLVCDLDHWHHDVFVGIEGKGEASMAGSKVQFLLDFDGEVEALRAVLEPSVPPIVFLRTADARFADPAFLQRLAGQYTLDAGTGTATVTVQGQRLVVTLPGQRHELEPSRGLTCQLRGVSGYRLEFVLDAKGEVTGARFHQPDGVYPATRKRD